MSTWHVVRTWLVQAETYDEALAKAKPGEHTRLRVGRGGTPHVSIEKLAWLLSQESLESLSLGEIAEQMDQPVERIIDAIDVLKLLRGEETQFPPVPWGRLQ